MTRSFAHRHSLAAILLAGTVLAGGSAFAEEGAASPGPLQLPPVVNQAGFSALATKVKPAVVNIATSEMSRPRGPDDMPDLPPGFQVPDMFRHFFGHRGSTPEHALGSGFIIDPAGYVVTNNHVVDGAHKITVTLDDGSSHPAKIIGRDSKTDLALLRIEAGKPLPYLAFGDSDKEQVGDWVVAVGNPFGLGGTVTAGIVSAHGRNINEGPYDDFLQIDAPINPGNSGGPLFNQSGQVIGIDTAIYSPNGGSVGIGFAIPSNLAARVVAQLREHGSVERGWLGVQMQSMTPALAKAVGLPKDEGVLVNQVLPDSPAEKAKLRQGDVITAFDGARIKSPRELALAVAQVPAGKTAKIDLLRDGHAETVTVSIGSQAKAEVEAGNADHDGGSVGMALTSLSNDEREELGLGPSIKGVVVAQVAEGSPADDSGIQPGDVIVRIGDTPVTTPGQAIARIRQAQQSKREAVPLLVTRGGTTYYIALQLAQG